MADSYLLLVLRQLLEQLVLQLAGQPAPIRLLRALPVCYRRADHVSVTVM